jgi:hypothetical protein
VVGEVPATVRIERGPDRDGDFYVYSTDEHGYGQFVERRFLIARTEA